MPSPVLDKLGYAAHIRLDVCPSSSSLSQVSTQQGVAHNKSCLSLSPLFILLLLLTV